MVGLFTHGLSPLNPARDPSIHVLPRSPLPGFCCLHTISQTQSWTASLSPSQTRLPLLFIQCRGTFTTLCSLAGVLFSDLPLSSLSVAPRQSQLLSLNVNPTAPSPQVHTVLNPTCPSSLSSDVTSFIKLPSPSSWRPCSPSLNSQETLSLSLWSLLTSPASIRIIYGQALSSLWAGPLSSPCDHVARSLSMSALETAAQLQSLACCFLPTQTWHTVLLLCTSRFSSLKWRGRNHNTCLKGWMEDYMR